MRLNTSNHFDGRFGQRCWRGFTLLEMLVVLIIIAMLAALALPAIRGSLESRAIDAASRQLLEDLSLARQKAISQRSTVAVVFISDVINDPGAIPQINADTNEWAAIQRLRAGILTHYAFFQFRRVGEQPGKSTHEYITEWKSLPEKTFFSTNTLVGRSNVLNLPHQDFDSTYAFRFPFPFTSSGNPIDVATPIQPRLPYIAFDPTGRLVKFNQGIVTQMEPLGDVAIAIARGAVFYARNNDGSLANFELQEIPPDNGGLNIIRVDGVTGRAEWLKSELQ